MRKSRGLTLTEKLIVIAIGIALIALIFPVMQRVRLLRAEMQCRANLHALALWFQSQ